MQQLWIKTRTKLAILRKNSKNTRVFKMISIILKVVANRVTFPFTGGAMSREKLT